MFKKIFHIRRFSFYDTVLISVAGNMLSDANWMGYAICGAIWIPTRVALNMYYKD